MSYRQKTENPGATLVPGHNIVLFKKPQSMVNDVSRCHFQNPMLATAYALQALDSEGFQFFLGSRDKYVGFVEIIDTGSVSCLPHNTATSTEFQTR